jgi:hypothetical protein
LAYHFDQVMSKGTISMVALLAVGSLLVALMVAAVAHFTSSGLSFGQQLWTAIRGVLSPSMPSGDEGSIGYVLVLVGLALCGIFITSMLISILSSGLRERMDTLRKGHSMVIASDHTVVLGFNEATFAVLTELIGAGANHAHQTVLVVDDQPKDRMEDQIRRRLPDTSTTRIVCRTGRIDVIDDLAICGLDRARSVIISPNDDFQAVRSVMAVKRLLDAHPGSETFMTVVAQESICGRAAELAGGDRAEVIDFQAAAAQIIAHCCRATGLSTVFTELFNNCGDEFYIEPAGLATGDRFDQANLRLLTATLVGLERAGQVKLNPDPSTIIAPDDRLVVIAADDGVAVPTAAALPAVPLIGQALSPAAQPFHWLVLGHNPLLHRVLAEEDPYLPPGSTATLVTNQPVTDLDGTTIGLANLTIRQVTGEMLDAATLRPLLDATIDSVLILADEQGDDDQADAEVMMRLLLVRSLAKNSTHHFSITTQMRTVRDQELAASDTICDFVVSAHLASLLAVQVSQTRELAAVFRDLLDADGSELYLRPASQYLPIGAQVDFASVALAVAGHGEVLVGYRSTDPKQPQRMKVTINPPKSQRLTFSADDMLVVLAQR